MTATAAAVHSGRYVFCYLLLPLLTMPKDIPQTTPKPSGKVVAKIRTKKLSDGTVLRIYFYGERKKKAGKRRGTKR